MTQKVFFGLVAYGNFPYTYMALETARRTTKKEINYVIVVGKPGDEETVSYANDFISKHGGPESRVIVHDKNYGFPWSLNDIYDVVWGGGEDNLLIVMGNDVIPYPKAINRLIKAAGQTDFDYISGMEMHTRTFQAKYPQYREYFSESGGINSLFLYEFLYQAQRSTIPFLKVAPWKAHYKDAGLNKERSKPREIGFINGYHNFAIVKKSYFEKVGYIDVGFYPAYFEDTDYVRRGFLTGCRHAEHPDAYYFHFWSRTVFDAQPSAVNERYFILNGLYFQDKWGGPPRAYLHRVPFAGAYYNPVGQIQLPPQDLCIPERLPEVDTFAVEYWKWTPRMFKNRHAGQRCIIAANGPGLNNIDMSLLKGEIVIGLNRGYLKEDMPITYLVSCNGQVLKDYGEEIVNQSTKATFITQGLEELWRPHVYGMKYKGVEEFTGDFDDHIWQGHTVTFVALQLAYYMGFSEVIFIGLDHYFPRAEGHETNKPIKSVGEDTDHFDPNYFAEGQTWETPNLEKSKEAYVLAREAFKAVGRAVVNASTKSRLRVFKRVNLKEILK